VNWVFIFIYLFMSNILGEYSSSKKLLDSESSTRVTGVTRHSPNSQSQDYQILYFAQARCRPINSVKLWSNLMLINVNVGVININNVRIISINLQMCWWVNMLRVVIIIKIKRFIVQMKCQTVMCLLTCCPRSGDICWNYQLMKCTATCFLLFWVKSLE